MNCEMDKLIEVAEELGWTVRLFEQDGANETDHIAELEQWSPAGEDFIVTVFFDGTAEGLADAVAEYYEDFDSDDHVEMWVEARKNGVSGVPRASVLVKDAEDIEKMLEELAIKMTSAAKGESEA